MVLYFAGTGNSLYVAKKLDDVRFSIPQRIHDEEEVGNAIEKSGIPREEMVNDISKGKL